MLLYFLPHMLAVILGLCIGSFLNVVIARLHKNEDFIRGRSYCPHCRHQLIWKDLVPLVSFLYLKGKCRYCYRKISWQYPIVEILTGVIFLAIFNLQSANLLFLWYIASVLIIIFAYDLKYYLIPDKVLFPSIIIAVLYRLLSDMPYFYQYALGALIASGFFLIIFAISRGQWMGFGDVKLAILLGLVLGFPSILVGLFLSFFFGAILGVGLIAFGKKGLKSQVPFAPFLIAGAFVALFWGPEILHWYTNFLIF